MVDGKRIEDRESRIEVLSMKELMGFGIGDRGFVSQTLTLIHS